MTGEFDLIARIRQRAGRAGPDSGVVLDIGDDAAVVQPRPGHQLVVTADNLVAGRHFDDAATPAQVGHLALAVNLSDLAAMGATPRWCAMTLTLPSPDTNWLDGFLDGFLDLAKAHGCVLIGGNLARGPLDISVTALGEVTSGRYATRAGARPGDRIVVTGTLGDAAACWVLELPLDHPLRVRMLRPTPRIEAGRELSGVAHAMQDLSDGLLADLGHVLEASAGNAPGAEIRCDRMPASGELKRVAPDAGRRWSLQCSGGDYELLAILPASAPLPEHAAGVPLTEIGRITETPGIRCLDDKGREIELGEAGGWDHFGLRSSNGKALE